MFNFSYSQDFCGTIEDGNYQKISSLSRMLQGDASSERDICMNVFFWIVRDDNGVDQFPGLSNLSGIINRLNTDFSPHNISFHNYGYNYIDNSNYLNLIYSEYPSLIAEGNNPNSLNIYLVDDAEFKGYAPILSQGLVIKKEWSSSKIISHEMGHCFNLLHTHSTFYGVENSENCSYAGDKICDTPPDPNLQFSNGSYKVDSNCDYTLNDGYNPDTENLMSYTPPTCMKHFTNGQGIRMRDAIMNTSFLQNAISCSCSAPTILGKENICSTETTTYSVPCGNVSFTLSSNLQALSTTPHSITVQPQSASTTGMAFIQTIVDGITYRKDIWIGNPEVDVALTSLQNYVDLKIEAINNNLHKQNITYIKWEILSSTGDATMGTAINSFSNLAHGTGTSWNINAKITVANECDTTFVYKDITPYDSSSPCGDTYSITKTSENEYSIFRVPDPCLQTTTTKNKMTKLPDDEIKKVFLFNSNGSLLITFDSNIINVHELDKGIYFLKAILKKKTITKAIIKN